MRKQHEVKYGDKTMFLSDKDVAELKERGLDPVNIPEHAKALFEAFKRVFDACPNKVVL